MAPQMRSPACTTAMPRWHQYTDGAWDGEHGSSAAAGPPNAGQNKPPPPAGFGVAEFTVRTDGADSSVTTAPLEQLREGGRPPAGCLWGALTWVDSGTVQLDDQASDWLEAPGHTNNTGELSAMYYALERAAGRQPGVGTELIHSDSLYAIYMTRGKWMPRQQGK